MKKEREDFDPNHPHGFMTRDGWAVRIITMTGGSEEFPIVGISDASLTPECWTKDGLAAHAMDRPKGDLINAPAPKRRVKGWLAGVTDGNGIADAVHFFDSTLFPDTDASEARLYAHRAAGKLYERAPDIAPFIPFAIPIDHELDGDPSGSALEGQNDE